MLGDAHYFLRSIARPGCKHGTEDRDEEVESLVFEIDEIARVTFFEANVGKLEGLGAGIARGDKIAGDVYSPNIRAGLRCGYRRRPVPATEVQHLHVIFDAERFDEGLSALAHRLSVT